MAVRLKQAICVCLLGALLVPAVATHAATYYVATSGNNSNPGTEKQPWRTIGHAVDSMVAGDTTYVRGGTYNTETAIVFRRSGTANAPIRLLNYPGETPIIDWPDHTTDRRILIKHRSGVNVAVGYITIEGFELRNGYLGIKFHSLHNSVIRKNWIHDNLTQGILGQGGHNNLFDRNIISHNGDFQSCVNGGLGQDGTTVCNKHHGMYLYGNFYTITNNLIYDNLSIGITYNASSSSVYSSKKNPSAEFAGASDWVVAHNVFAYHSYGPGITLWGANGHRTRIENNIFYENRQVGSSGESQGIGSSSFAGTRFTIRNNLAFATTPGGTAFIASRVIEGTHYTQSGNIVNISAPGFVNAPATVPASPNFSLTERSPAIDAGTSFTVSEIDFNGTRRPQGRAPDIGSYEYTIGQSIGPPKALKFIELP